MSPSPVDDKDTEGIEQYSAAWQAIMQLVRRGSSWSGYERNCCFLNLGGKYAEASHVSGLDFADDGRGLAVTDWDQDGDLDLWFRNRTAPRLRLLLNQASNEGVRRFVAFKLTGTTSNRDAVGAVVELRIAENSDQRFVRSVSAGDMFLSQSSKWVHFGLPEGAAVDHVRVLWPGGEISRFDGIESGNRYLLEQGASAASPIGVKRAVDLKTAPLATKITSTGVASLVLPAPIPLPVSSYFDESGAEVSIAASKHAKLLVLWSADCPHCKVELTRLQGNVDGLDVLALCVDGNTSEARGTAKALISEAGFTGAWGMIGADALERVQILQEALFDKTPDFAVPLSMLLRPGNEMVALYRGPLPHDTLAHDSRVVVTATDSQLRNLAPPFPGRWFTRPAAPSFLPKMIARRIQASYPEDAVAYLRLAAEKSGGAEKQELLSELGRKHYSLARRFVEKRQAEDAVFHFTQSIAANPNAAKVHNDFGTVLAQLGRVEEGAKHFAEAVRLRPDYALAKKNLARAQELLRQSGQ